MGLLNNCDVAKVWTFCLLGVCLVQFSVGFTIGQAEDESFLESPHYHNTEEVAVLFDHLQKEFPDFVKVSSIGKSRENRDLLVIEIRKDVSRPRQLLTPMFKFVANMHGDETVGRQLLVYLAEYLLRNYGKVKEVTDIVDQTDIYLMPSLNPDGFERSVVSRKANIRRK
jgi:carboxypeptidase D